MNFISNVLNSIPGVGHVKAIIHYAAGDTNRGNKAMYQSTRTTAVLAGGAAGSMTAGPAGALAGGACAGIATDSLASLATNKPQGVIRSCKRVGKDIASGRDATKSVLYTGRQVATDGLDGVGIGGYLRVAQTIDSVGRMSISSESKQNNKHWHVKKNNTEKGGGEPNKKYRNDRNGKKWNAEKGRSEPRKNDRDGYGRRKGNTEMKRNEATRNGNKGNAEKGKSEPKWNEKRDNGNKGNAEKRYEPRRTEGSRNGNNGQAGRGGPTQQNARVFKARTQDPRSHRN